LFKVFSGGVHPKGYKSTTKDKPIRQAGLPERVILPLDRQIGKPSRAVVGVGDRVCAGTKVGRADGFISGNVHSPISGTVRAIEPAYHPVLGKALSVIIESDGKNEQAPPVKTEGIVEAVSEAGVVGAGGACFPTHVKLSPPKGKSIDILIINGAECEPYLTCDHRLMLERPDDILKGGLLMCQALGVKRCIVAVEDNKPDAVKAMQTAVSNYSLSTIGYRLNVIPLPTKYPQGAEKQLIKTLIDKEVPSAGLPFDIGAVVQNVGTAVAVYEAVALNKPFCERVVTVSGDCIKEPANLLVKIGTPAKDLVEECGGFVSQPAKVVFGGPIMGVAQWTLDLPVLKGTGGILFLSKAATDLEPEGVCIRCGGCVRVCPAGLEPTNIYYAAQNDKLDLLDEYSALDCIECGACGFECPAKLDLVGLIRYAKVRIRKT
jgi:electron transport complex protein RnfC